MDWSYASRGFVTQMAQIAQIFCIAALAGFLFALPCGQKSCKSCRLFPFGDYPGAGTLILWIFIRYRWLRAMDWSYASRGFVTQMAQIAQIFCIAALAGFLFALPCGQKSWESCRLFPSGILFRVRGWLKSRRFL